MSSISVKPNDACFLEPNDFDINDLQPLAAFNPGQSLGLGIRGDVDLLASTTAANGLVNNVGRSFHSFYGIDASRGIRPDAGRR
jgi:hypothetical protein